MKDEHESIHDRLLASGLHRLQKEAQNQGLTLEEYVSTASKDALKYIQSLSEKAKKDE